MILICLQWEVTKASRMPKRAKGVFNNAQKIASLARQTSKARPCMWQAGVVESAGGMNTPLALFGMREAFVTLPTEGRLAVTFHHRRTQSSLSLNISLICCRICDVTILIR